MEGREDSLGEFCNERLRWLKYAYKKWIQAADDIKAKS